MDTVETRDENAGKEIWFKRRRFGWGCVPCTWQGWLILVAYLAIVLGLGSAVSSNPTGKELSLGFILPVSLATAGLIRISYAYGESPRWEWGNEK